MMKYLLNSVPAGKARAKGGAGGLGIVPLLIVALLLMGGLGAKAGGADVGDKYPFQLTKPGHISVVVIVGWQMKAWFVRNVVSQAQAIADKYGDNVGVEVKFYSGSRYSNYYKAGDTAITIPTSTIVSQTRSDLLTGGATPMMYIMDRKKVIRLFQDGWTGFKDDDLKNRAWLMEVASKCLDQLEAEDVAAGRPVGRSAAQ